MIEWAVPASQRQAVADGFGDVVFGGCDGVRRGMPSRQIGCHGCGKCASCAVSLPGREAWAT